MQDQDETPAETIPETSRYTVIGVAEAARRLGVTQDAVRKRLQRGTLQGIKTGSTWDVIETDELEGTTLTETLPGQDTVSGRPENVPDATDSRLVTHLQDENSYLREQLAATIRQLAAERERADVLQREALDRIAALTATVEPPESPETEMGDDSEQDDGDTETGVPGARGDFLERLIRWLRGT